MAAAQRRRGSRSDSGGGPPPSPETVLHLAIRHHQAGRLAEAEPLYRRLLAAHPGHPDCLHLLGVLAHQSDRHDMAVDLIGQAIRAKGGEPFYHNNLGSALKALGRLEEAVPRFRRALALKPDYPEALYNLGNALLALDRLDEAADCYRQALTIQPDFVPVLGNLGGILLGRGRAEEAVPHLERALALDPEQTSIRDSLGRAYLALGRAEKAAACFEHLLAHAPDTVEAHYALGLVLLDLDRPDEAADCFERALVLKPDFAEAEEALGRAWFRLRRFDEAMERFERALTLKPQLMEARRLLAALYRSRGRFEETIPHFKWFLALTPNHAETHCALGEAFRLLDRFEEAVPCFERALALDPDHVGAHANLGSIFHAQGRLHDAMAHYEWALALKPDNAIVHSTLIFTLDLIEPAVDLATQQAERRRWCRLHAAPAAQGTAVIHANRPDPERRLRVGYVSADFRRHSASVIFGAVLLNHDPARIETVCYVNSRQEDDYTARFRAAAALWRPLSTLTDREVADLIRADGIDILVDLSGHSPGNRLMVFALKPAPVQITAWGHATGTGVAAIDAFLTDPIHVPAADRPLFAEEPVDLPCVICYDPPPDAPPVAPGPGRAGVSFGCFNRISKLGDRTLATWSRILAGCPGSRLVIKSSALSDTPTRALLAGRCRSWGIAEERLVLLGNTPQAEHLAAHAEIDIALDPFPQNGGTSTLEALWMGVPVLTLAGTTPASRNGVAILTALDLPDWIATDPADYVARARALATDRPRLAELRQTLRPRLAASPVGDRVRYTRAVEARYRELWHRWCAGRTAESDGDT